MMPSPEQRRAAIQAATADFVAFRASHQTRSLIALFDALIAQYFADLATVKPERLAHVQGALAQVIALRNLACQDNPHLSPLA